MTRYLLKSYFCIIKSLEILNDIFVKVVWLAVGKVEILSVWVFPWNSVGSMNDIITNTRYMYILRSSNVPLMFLLKIYF